MGKHTFFMNIHGTLTKNKYVLGPKSGLNKYKDLVIQTMFIDDSAIKLEIKKKKKDIFKKSMGIPWWSGGKNSPCNAGDVGFISVWGTKIPHALPNGQKSEKQNKTNKKKSTRNQK